MLGNVYAPNFVGTLANGNSNVRIFSNANIEFTVNGQPNVATITDTGLYVVGQINSTAGNMLSNGNITANSFLNSANAKVTGEANINSVLTSNITAPVNTITISAAGTNQNVILAPSGSGNVDVGLHHITQLATPENPNDAATKEYVDNISQGLYIHPSANVISVSNLTASYVYGGTALTATTISGGKTITFSTNHGLLVNDDIEFDNSFDGIIADAQYFVYSTPALNQITIKDGYYGAEITTLTNATGLTEPAIGNGGVGATLTNAGTQAALTIDSILMTVGKRVLVQGQTSQLENGIYDVSVVGTLSTNWVLTRSSDGDTYQPKSTTSLCAGSYFFITQGTQYAGSSYVLTAPPYEIDIGVDAIIFAQFSKAGSYTAGSGIDINGTIISANVDNVTTDIQGGNIVVKTSANLTTPNIGDATFSSLTWNTLSNGNVTANNLSIGNIANITGNLRVDGLIQANGNISSNANVNSNNTHVTNFVEVGANLIANNINANYLINSTDSNISNLVIAGNVTVTYELSGNTANFTGNINSALNANLGNLVKANYVNVASNVISNNVTVNLELSGNTANFSSNVILNNLTTNLELQANTANFDGNVIMDNWLTVSNTANVGNLRTDHLLYANGNPWDLQEAAGANTQIQYNDGLNNFGASANLTFDYAAQKLGVIGDANISNAVIIGNTTTTWATTETHTVSANQTISSIPISGITGVQFFVKGVDALGSKYSVATVQAVTDGTSVDYATYGTVSLGGYIGSLSVNVAGGAYLRLQVTPASGNSTIWTTQYRFI